MDKNEKKKLEKAELEKQIQKYLKKGGKVDYCPEGAITDEGQMNYKFRRNKKSPKSSG
tara:strand:+ start:183 stop:356 length:174 start_codon:yes stop_codon:yes gene_type:complete